jgi:hypothetical protein
MLPLELLPHLTQFCGRYRVVSPGGSRWDESRVSPTSYLQTHSALGGSPNPVWPLPLPQRSKRFLCCPVDSRPYSAQYRSAPWATSGPLTPVFETFQHSGKSLGPHCGVQFPESWLVTHHGASLASTQPLWLPCSLPCPWGWGLCTETPTSPLGLPSQGGLPLFTFPDLLHPFSSILPCFAHLDPLQCELCEGCF